MQLRELMRTVPYKARQNGIAERMNRILNERASSMMIHCRLPKTFWADDVSTSAYLICRGPSTPLGFKILEEVWIGKELKYSHLRTFGCTLMFILIQKIETSLMPRL